jgi:nucleoside-diphosphate-sugar epimerase
MIHFLLFLQFCVQAEPHLKLDYHRNHEEQFFWAALELPKLLEQLRQAQQGCTLYIPRGTHLVNPSTAESYFAEACRLCKTWCSVFNRLYKTHFNFIEYEDVNRLDSSISAVPGYQKRFVEKQTILETDFPPLKDGQERVFIAGGAGFIGSHLVDRLIEEGHQVIVVDNYRCCLSTNLDHYKNHPLLHVFEHDISHPFLTSQAVTAVINAASVPSPEFYYKLPLETLFTGIDGSLNCLELARVYDAKYLFTSTSEVYGDPEISPQPEWYPGRVNPTGLRACYDESKRAGETLALYYAEHYELDVRIARIFNTYGPRMALNDGRVIPNFIRQIQEGTPCTVYGEGTQTRSFGYVSDTVEGLMLLFCAQLHELSASERVFNIGNPEEYTIYELALKTQAYARACGKDTEIIFVPLPDIDDPKKRNPNISRSQLLLGFHPKVKLHEGLSKTCQWYWSKSS